MKTPLRVRTGVVAFAMLAACMSPRAAATERIAERDGEIPVIRVIVDHEAQLALIPKGTILPAGFQILSSRDESADGRGVTSSLEPVSRPLVFAYAPATRFEKLSVVETPREALADVVTFAEPGLTAIAATTTENPCPAVIVVQVADDVVHQVTCSYYTHPSGIRSETFRTFTSYPTTARSSRIILKSETPNGSIASSTTYTCSPSAGECWSPTWGYQAPFQAGWNHISTASIRLPGACTQDPPFCPFYSNTIVLPIVSP